MHGSCGTIAASTGQRTRQPSSPAGAHSTAPLSPAFHGHRPAALRVGTFESLPAAGPPRSCSRPSSAPASASVDPELTHVRTLDKLVASLHSPSRRQQARGTAVLTCSSPQHSPIHQGRLSSGNSITMRGLPRQGRAGGARYYCTEACQLQVRGVLDQYTQLCLEACCDVLTLHQGGKLPSQLRLGVSTWQLLPQYLCHLTRCTFLCCCRVSSVGAQVLHGWTSATTSTPGRHQRVRQLLLASNSSGMACRSSPRRPC